MAEWIVSSSVLIAIIILLRFVLKGKISLRLQYALWSLVLLRLLVPVSFGGTAISVENLTRRAADMQPVRFVSSSETTLPKMSYQVPYREVAEDYAEKGTQSEDLSPKQHAQTIDYEIKSKMNGSLSIAKITRIVWVCGTFLILLWFVIANLHLSVKLKKSRSPLRLEHSRLPIYVTDAVDTPCLFGLFHPTIYLTGEAAADLLTTHHTVEHELTHYYHKDNIWAILRSLCLAIHWFNPLVWCAAVLSRNDAELACDESTILRLGESERVAYGRTLISLTCEKRPALLNTATTMTGRGIKERISLIVKKPKMALYTAIAVLLIAVVAVGCTFTGAKDENTPQASITVLEDTNVPEAVIDYAKSYVQQHIDHHNEIGSDPTESAGSYSIIDANIRKIERINTGTAGLNDGLNLYLLEYRLRPDHPENVSTTDGMTMEDGLITEWSSNGQPYLLLHYEHRGSETIWTPICITGTNVIEAEYGTPEMLEKYGNPYTAAATELYAEHLGAEGAEGAEGTEGAEGAEPSETEEVTEPSTEEPTEEVFAPVDAETPVVEAFAGTYIRGYETINYSIPLIQCESTYAQAVNQELSGFYNDYVDENGYYGRNKSFDWYVNGDVLSLVVYHFNNDCDHQYKIPASDYEWDFRHSIYNIRMSDGSQVTDEEILELAGVSVEDFRARAQRILGNAYIIKSLPHTHAEAFYNALLENDNPEDPGWTYANFCKTVSDENLDLIELFLGEDGALCFKGRRYYIAGGFEYATPLFDYFAEFEVSPYFETYFANIPK